MGWLPVREGDQRLNWRHLFMFGGWFWVARNSLCQVHWPEGIWKGVAYCRKKVGPTNRSGSLIQKNQKNCISSYQDSCIALQYMYCIWSLNTGSHPLVEQQPWFAPYGSIWWKTEAPTNPKEVDPILCRSSPPCPAEQARLRHWGTMSSCVSGEEMITRIEDGSQVEETQLISHMKRLRVCGDWPTREAQERSLDIHWVNEIESCQTKLSGLEGFAGCATSLGPRSSRV